MKKTISLLLTALLFANCSDKPEMIDRTIDDTFFFAHIGKNGYDMKNDGAKRKAIWTVTEHPTYRFIFRYTFKTELFIPNIESTTLRVDLENPEDGKTYSSALGVPNGQPDSYKITCEIATQANETSTVEKKLYKPQNTKEPVFLEVLKVDKDPSSGVKIVEGNIKGYLYNDSDLQDSIRIDARFRTKSYNQN